MTSGACGGARASAINCESSAEPTIEGLTLNAHPSSILIADTHIEQVVPMAGYVSPKGRPSIGTLFGCGLVRARSSENIRCGFFRPVSRKGRPGPKKSASLKIVGAGVTLGNNWPVRIVLAGIGQPAPNHVSCSAWQ